MAELTSISRAMAPASRSRQKLLRVTLEPTVLMAALALFFFGGSAIADFAFILIIGFAVGTYSSVFVASALAADWKGHK